MISIVLLGFICISSNALSQNIKEYIIPKINASIKVPEYMVPISDSEIVAQNNDMLRLRPQSLLRYVYGFINSKNKPIDGMGEHIFITMSPMSVPPMSPEKLLQMLPKTYKEKKEEFSKLLSNSVNYDNLSGTFNKETGAVIFDSTLSFPDQTLLLLRSYIILTKKYIITINSYAPPNSAIIFFDLSNQIVKSLEIKKEDKMPDSWLDKLQQLINI